MIQQGKSKQILLIDDDEDYRKVLISVGAAFNLKIDGYSSLTELGSMGCIGNYAGLVVDYHLEELNGLEICEYVDVFFPDLPVVLITIDDTIPVAKAFRSKCMKKFVNKALGPYYAIRKIEEVFYPSKSREGQVVNCT